LKENCNQFADLKSGRLDEGFGRYLQVIRHGEESRKWLLGKYGFADKEEKFTTLEVEE